MNNNAPVRASGGGRKRKKSSNSKSSITRINPPDELLDQQAVRMWKTQSKILIERGTFELEDAPLLLAYCNSFSLMIQAEIKIADSNAEGGGMVVSTADGGFKKNPHVAVRNDCISQLSRLGSLLGLDPLTRQRLLGGSSDDGVQEENEFSEF